MILVHKGCENLNPNGILDRKENFLSFDSEQDVRDFKPKLSNRFPKNSQYVIVRKGPLRDPKELRSAIKKYRPKSLVIWDASGKDWCKPELIEFCDKYVYLKENLSELTYRASKIPDGMNLVASPQTPPKRFINMVLEHKIERISLDKKSYDVSFMGSCSGDSRSPRKRGHKRLRLAAGNLGLRSMVKNTERSNITPLKYAQIMNQSKLCFSYRGCGLRCRRESEALLVGSALIMGPEMRQVQMSDFVEGEHFVFEESNLEDHLRSLLKNRDLMEHLSESGYKLAREFYVDHPLCLDERFFRIYLLNASARINSLDNLKSEERSLNLKI